MPTSASSPVRKLFDYDSLDNEDAVFVQQQTGAIQSLIKRSAQDVWDIGQRLIEVKRRLRHGRFEAWLNAEFEWTQMTATRFINVAKRFKSNNLLDLTIAPSALYELAAPSTREDVRAEAIARAKAGESITYSTAKGIKQKYSSPPSQEPKVKPEAETQPQTQLDNLQAQAPLSAPPSRSSEVVAPPTSVPAPAPQSIPVALPRPPIPETIPKPSIPLTVPETIPKPPIPSTISPPTVAPLIPQARQRATEPSGSKLEIMAIRPREAEEPAAFDEIAEAEEPAVPPAKTIPKFVQPGSWWQLGEEHLLYCGDPASPRFRERLPEQIALSLAFPWDRNNWPQPPAAGIVSALALSTRFLEDQDFQIFREAIERFMMLYTNGGESVVFSFLPDSGMLFLAHELQCRWFCAEPDPARCEAAIKAWKEKGLRAEKVSGLRF